MFLEGLSVKFFQTLERKLVILLHPNCVRLSLCTFAPGNMSFVLLGICWERYEGRSYVQIIHYFQTSCLSSALSWHSAATSACLTFMSPSPCHQFWAPQHAVVQPGVILRLCLFRHQELQHPQLWNKSSERVISSLLCCIRQLLLPCFLFSDGHYYAGKILCRCWPYRCCDAKITQRFNWFVR